MYQTQDYRTGYLDALKDLAAHIDQNQWIRAQQWKMTAAATAAIPHESGESREV